VLQLEVLILELVAVDGLATSAVASGEITTLTHEVGDDTVELGALETESLLTSAEGTEVLCSLGHDISSQLHHDPASWLVVDSHVEENLWVAHIDGY